MPLFTLSIHKSTIPASIDQTYIPFGFYKLGLGCWVYTVQGAHYDGEIEWINTLNFVSKSKLANPCKFRFVLRDGILGDPAIVPEINNDIADSAIAGTAINWAIAKGLTALNLH